jgi:DNA-binding LacI/PurR family transcriptional regulator
VRDGQLYFFENNRKQQRILQSYDDALGFLIQTPGCEPPELLLDYAIRKNKPVAMMDENGVEPSTFTGKGRLPFVTFQIGADSGPAETIGQYLLQLGHHHIAYISPLHASKWSETRYEGLCKVYASAGYEKGVSAFTIDNFALPEDYQREMIESHNLSPFLNQCDMIEKSFFSLPETSFGSLRERAVKYLLPSEIRSRLTPMFDRISADPTITAWVGCNDTVAIAALHYLNVTKKTPVPESISIVGFDNTLEAFNNNVTSFDFNIPTTVRSMIDFILNPARFMQNKSGKVQFVKGMLVKRGSTGPACG